MTERRKTELDGLKSGWMGDVPADFADEMLAMGQWQLVPGGEILYGHGAESRDLFGIADGSLHMRIAMNEHEQRLAHICGPGFWFGENELISGSARILETEASEDLVLLRIPAHDFLHLARSRPDAWRWIALLAVQHQALAIGAADDLMLPSAAKRLIGVLLRLSGNRLNNPASPALTVIHLTQQELAVAANLSRASAGRILRELAGAGDIAIDYSAISILNAAGLAKRLT